MPGPGCFSVTASLEALPRCATATHPPAGSMPPDAAAAWWGRLKKVQARRSTLAPLSGAMDSGFQNHLPRESPPPRYGDSWPWTIDGPGCGEADSPRIRCAAGADRGRKLTDLMVRLNQAFHRDIVPKYQLDRKSP